MNAAVSQRQGDAPVPPGSKYIAPARSSVSLSNATMRCDVTTIAMKTIRLTAISATVTGASLSRRNQLMMR